MTQVDLRCDCSGLATWWRPVARARALRVERRKAGICFSLEAFFLTTLPAAVDSPRLPFCLEFVWLPRRRRVRLRLPDGVECVCGKRLLTRFVMRLWCARQLLRRVQLLNRVLRPTKQDEGREGARGW